MAKVVIPAEVERLKVQMEALLKAREAMNERIIALSERIGELRSSLVDHERRSSDLEARMKKAIELINQVKPEELLREVSKSDAKTEAVKTRINSIEAVSDRIIEEMKEMRRTFIQFKDLETVAKLAEGLREDLKNAKKVEASIERSASKVESIFREVEKRYEEVKDIEKRVDELQLRFRELLKEFDKLKIEFVGVAKKEDVEKLEKRLEVGLKEAEELSIELKERSKELKEIILSSKKMARVTERISTLMEERNTILEKLSLLDELVDSFRALKLNVEKLDNRLTILEEFRKRTVTREKISGLERKVEKKILEFDKLTQEIRRKVEFWDKKLGKVFKVSSTIIKTSAQLKNFEKAIKKLEKRQKEIVELIEALV